MNGKKFFLGIISFFLASILVFPQTLVEIAKKERERRESLKGKKGMVVTNAELAKLKKKPALEIPLAAVESETGGSRPQEPPPEPLPETASQAGEPVLPGPSGEAAGKGPASGLPLNETSLKTLQERWEKAREYVELLTLKMGALWQEFSNAENPGARESIQLAIAETFLKLQNAQEEEEKARQELEKFLGQMKRESTPSLWIK